MSTPDQTDDGTDVNARGARDLVAGLADAGVRVAFVSPGSRNTPLTLAIAAAPAIKDVVIRDERSAGFAALGYAKATGVPAIVSCTSGSAATHYFPAVAEADQAGVPLIVVSADRPVNLRGTSAPQTMDQTDLYGSHVKAFLDIDIGHDGMRETGRAVVATAVSGIGGAIHINVPFDEPLTPQRIPDGLPSTQDSNQPTAVPGPIAVLPDLTGRRVLVVAGGSHGKSFPAALGAFAERIGAVLFADIQCRPRSANTVDHADLLAAVGCLETEAPDLIIRIGGLPTSKSLSSWLASTGIEQIAVNHSRLSAPLSNAPTSIDLSPHTFVTKTRTTTTADASFVETWKELDGTAAAAIGGIGGGRTPTEPAIARSLLASVPSGSAVFVGSSMPIRDLDSFGVARSDIHIVANRGINGIDGSVSTALGMALAGVPTTALIGDIAALHDATALAEVAALGAPVRIVVVNNDGGGIFSFLPQATAGSIPNDSFERYWGTPHGLSLVSIAEAFGLDARAVDDLDGLGAIVSGVPTPSLVEMRTDRSDNVNVHADILTAVSERLGAR